MPILPPGPETPLTYTVQDLIVDALIEAGILSPGEGVNLDPDMAQWAFRKLNYLIDIWQAQGAYVWAKSFELFTLTVGLSPHTIGPGAGATFATSIRPVRIPSAALILNTGSPIDLPMNSRDSKWWAEQQVKSIQTNIPTDYYYDPTYIGENGQIYFWPVPNEQNQVRLQLWFQLQEYSQITDALAGPNETTGTLPPAYRAALMYTLAEMLLPSAKLQAHPVLVESAKQARIAVFGNNMKSPRAQTRDLGMPRSGRSKPDFNWATGGYPGGPPE
jgi:hypothetical protein